MNLRFSDQQSGNALLISLGVSSLLLLGSASAISMISQSSQTAVHLENSQKALFSAESALELALFDMAGHAPGWSASENLDGLDIDFSKINSSTGSWSISSRNAASTFTDEDPGKVFLPSSSDDPKTWAPLAFGEKMTLNFFQDQGVGKIPLSLKHERGFPRTLPSSDIHSLSNIQPKNDLEDITIQLFFPRETLRVDSDQPLLSWSLEGDSGTTALQLFSENDCSSHSSSETLSSICLSDLWGPRNEISRQNMTVTQKQDPPGILVEIKNPRGKFRDDEGKFTYAELRDFLLSDDILDADGDVFYFSLENPRLSLQIGNPPSFPGTAGVFVRTALSFSKTLSEEDISSLALISDPSFTIEAFGTSGKASQSLRAEIFPQSLAPMFQYALFQ